MTKLLYTSLLILIAWGAVASDVIYTWVDEKGIRHYSQQPPLGDYKITRLHNEDLEPQRIGTVSPARQLASAAPSEDDNMAKQAEQIKQQNSEQAKSICDNARHSLNVLLTHAQISQEDPDSGEAVKMTEEQKRTAIKENQRRIKLFCGE